VGVVKMERRLWEVLRSERGRNKKWLRRKLEGRGVEIKFANIIAQRKAANKDLLKFNGREINKFFYSLIEEYAKAGFDEKVALSALGNLRELKKLGLPINTKTIFRSPKTLLKNKEELERLGIPITPTNLAHKPETLAKRFFKC
jgi:DNA repair exonuclease SbcCD nuclease subunit